MMKQNIAVFFGGHSPEYEVSLQSAYSVIRNLNPSKYNVIPVGITRQGEWYYFHGAPGQIPENTWYNPKDCTMVVLSPNRGAHSLLLLQDGQTYALPIDVALPILHGRNGEDGTLQGLIELAGIPLAGCGTLSSALCMDKDRAHRLVQAAGINVPHATVIRQTAFPKAQASMGETIPLVPTQPAADGTAQGTADLPQKIAAFIEEVGFPLFVKPVKAGSSYGVTRVSSSEELQGAIRLAFQYDNQVILEEAIPGFEVGCAVLGNQELRVGEVDEIELSGGFFDYTEKYTLKTSAIHVPARIDKLASERIKDAARTVYRALDCRCFARVDFFLTPEGRIVFNEVNTIPGFTEHSRYPKMMEAAGLSFSTVLDNIISLARS